MVPSPGGSPVGAKIKPAGSYKTLANNLSTSGSGSDSGRYSCSGSGNIEGLDRSIFAFASAEGFFFCFFALHMPYLHLLLWPRQEMNQVIC